MINNNLTLTKQQRRINNIKSWLSSPANVVVLLFFIVLFVLIVYPLFAVVNSSITVGQRDSMMYNSLFGQSLKKGDFSFNNFAMLLGDKYTEEYSRAFFWRPLWNSLMMSIFASLISVILGGAIAFLITRTDIKFKKFISSVFIFPYLMPSWTLGLVWKNVFLNSSIGNGVSGWFEAVTGICVPEWFVYGLFPCSLVLGIHYAPFAYILIGGMLRNMDANLEEAATILQASRFRIIRKITLPIVLPSMISTMLLVFASSMASFSVPNFIGTPGNFFVLSTMLKSLYQSSYSGQAYVMTLVLILFGIGFLVLNDRVVGNRKSFTTVTGKSGQVSYIRIGKSNFLVSSILIVFLFAFAVFPMISFGLESLCLNQGNYSQLTLKYWLSHEDIQGFSRNVGQGLLFNPRVWGALWGSVRLSIVVALVVGTCGFLIGYGVSRKRGSKLAKAVSNLSFFPYLIPTMAFGSIWLAVSAKLPFLRGTFFLLVLVAALKYLPFATRSGTSAMMQLSGEIEESAIIVGSPWFIRMTKILFPIQKSSFISGYLLPFVSCMRELTLFVLLANRDSVITMLLSFYDESDISQMSNGVNLIIIIVVLLINFIVNKLTGASLDKGIGGN